MNIKLCLEVLILIAIIANFIYLSCQDLSERLQGKTQNLNFQHLSIFLVVALNMLLLDLEIIWLALIISLLIITPPLIRSIRQKRNSQISYSELAFALFQLSLSLRAGVDLLTIIKDISKNTSLKISNIFGRISNGLEKGFEFETICNQILLESKDAAVRQFLLQLIVAFNSGASIGKSVEEIGMVALEYQQDAIDREIAKMPIKATLPLLLVFSGCLILMIAPPLVSLMEFSKEIIIK